MSGRTVACGLSTYRAERGELGGVDGGGNDGSVVRGVGTSGKGRGSEDGGDLHLGEGFVFAFWRLAEARV